MRQHRSSSLPTKHSTNTTHSLPWPLLRTYPHSATKLASSLLKDKDQTNKYAGRIVMKKNWWQSRTSRIVVFILFCALGSQQAGCFAVYSLAKAKQVFNGGRDWKIPMGPKEMVFKATPSGFAPFQATCDVKTRHRKVKHIEHSVLHPESFAILMGISMGLYGLFAAGASWGFIQSSKNYVEETGRPLYTDPSLIVGLGFSAAMVTDLTATLIGMITDPPKKYTKKKVRVYTPSWRLSKLCPRRLRLELEGRQYKVQRNGRLYRRGELAWVDTVLGPADTFTLVHGPTRMRYPITPKLRCIVADAARPRGWQRFCPAIRRTRVAIAQQAPPPPPPRMLAFTIRVPILIIPRHRRHKRQRHHRRHRRHKRQRRH